MKVYMMNLTKSRIVREENMNEAQLRGINLERLRTESPSHPKQVRIARAHRHFAETYWAKQRSLPLPKRERPKYNFTEAQLALIDDIVERKKALLRGSA